MRHSSAKTNLGRPPAHEGFPLLFNEFRSHSPQLSQGNFGRAATIRCCRNTGQGSLLEPDLSEGTQGWALPSLTPKARHRSLGKQTWRDQLRCPPPFPFSSFQKTRDASSCQRNPRGCAALAPLQPFRVQHPPNTLPLLKICPSSSCSINPFMCHPSPLLTWKGQGTSCHPGRTGMSCCGLWGCLQELSPRQVSTIPARRGRFRWQH